MVGSRSSAAAASPFHCFASRSGWARAQCAPARSRPGGRERVTSERPTASRAAARTAATRWARDHVVQFSHVAGPVAVHQPIHTRLDAVSIRLARVTWRLEGPYAARRWEWELQSSDVRSCARSFTSPGSCSTDTTCSFAVHPRRAWIFAGHAKYGTTSRVDLGPIDRPPPCRYTCRAPAPRTGGTGGMGFLGRERSRRILEWSTRPQAETHP